ncbi:uncharacterized protein LTR77_004979 [Saxophila tyrrhenica]|uniref:Basic proline-rich protein n=1 Tax=Saxophila tyrrhenica TaxID=1690608 RepID=A0AAV9PE33_9PEZI|nr:hypothetical protein LTR77_004979 [Saxophila tyrrhenica]
MGPRAQADAREEEEDQLNFHNTLLPDMDLSSPSPRSASPASQQTRPPNPRSSTDPSPAVLLQGLFKEREKLEWARPSSSHRNRSPYSRSHLRSRSSGSALLSAPQMTRAHSLPLPQQLRPFEQQSGYSSGSLSPSPSQRSPARTRSPFRQGQEDGAMPPSRLPAWYDSGSAIEAIQEDSELDITPRPSSAHTMISPLPQHSSSHSRSNSLRRRPASPLHSLGGAPQQAPTSYPGSTMEPNAQFNTIPSGSNSPALGPQKYNESFPSLHHYASSSSFGSIPSTPTSARSRSPSISSLDTIEDAPEEESEAIETERMERLRIAAERAEQGESDSEGEGTGNGRRKGSLDLPRYRSGTGLGREKKRWSVCGGERRADLDLETIWED